jgi:tetratricopeptide (TPR) repeat protein
MVPRTLIRPLWLAALSLAWSNTMALDVSSLWDHGKPDLSERRFRDALATASPGDALVLQTQIARTWGIRKDFARAREILASIESQVKSGPPEARVRYFLELGRTYASATHPPQSQTVETRQTARSMYTQAFEAARQAGLDELAVDALHMMSFVDTEPKDQLAWDLKAIAYMEGSTQPRAKNWEASLYNNVGYAMHGLGRYDEALAHFKLSLAAHERGGNARRVRIAHWMIAWTLRAQGKFQEAIAIQLRLEREWEQDSEPDPYVFEELEHLYRATHDAARADAYAAKLAQARKK